MREADSTPVGTDGRLRLFMEDLLTPFKVAQIKIDNEYEEKRKSLEANYTSRRKAKVQEQHKAFQALLQRQQVELKRVKAGLELPKRVVVMADTIRKLRLQRANKAADELERLRARLEDKFWRETLGEKGGPLHGMELEQRQLRDRQELELSEMAVEMERLRKEWAAKRTMAVQRSKQGVVRKGDHPFSIWFYAGKGQIDSLSRMLSRHPDRLDQPDPDTGHTPLHYAARNGQVEVVRLLLEKGANVDCRDGQGNTVLHLGAGWGNVKVVALLLEAGAGVRCRNLDGKTAGELAAEKGMRRVQAFLDNWEPMGVSLEEREKIVQQAAQDPFAHVEQDPVIRQQLRVLEMRQSGFGPTDASLLPTLKKLVQLYRKQSGRESSAMETLARYLSVAEQAKGELSIEVAWASNEMGEMLHSAKAARRKKRRQQQQQPKGDSAGAGKSRAESEEEEDQQDLDEGMRAAECFQRAVLVLERVQGPKSPELETPLRNLALHYLSESMVYEAEPVLRRLANLQEERHTTEMGSVPESPLIPTLDLLAYTLLLKRDFAGARSLYERALAIARQYHTEEHSPALAPRLENLAMVSFCEGDDRRAEEGFRRTHDLLVRGGADPFGLSVLRLATNASIAACRASARKF